MKFIADQLPPEIARQLHPDRRKNETEYWAIRDQLLQQYQDQWIGFADGRVIASGTSPVTVLHAAEASGRLPFVICVGHEDEPCRIRRATFAYERAAARYRGIVSGVERTPSPGVISSRFETYLRGPFVSTTRYVDHLRSNPLPFNGDRTMCVS